MRTALLVLAAALPALAAPAIAEGGTLLVLNKSDDTLDFVDPATLEATATLPTGAGPHEVALSPDGRTAVVADYGGQTPGRTLSVYDVAERERLRVVDLGEHRRPHGIQFEDETHVLVTVEQSQAVIRVDVEKGVVDDVLRTGQNGTHMLVIAPDRSRVYTANIGSGTMSAIDLRTGELLANVETGAGAEGIDVTPDGKEVWVTNRSADTVSVVDAEKLAVVHQLPCASFPIRVEITPDGEHALVSNPVSGDVTVFHVETHLELRRVPMELAKGQEVGEGFFGGAAEGSPQPIGILVTPDGRRAFVANTSVNLVFAIDLGTWRVDGRIATGNQPDGLGWTDVAASTE